MILTLWSWLYEMECLMQLIFRNPAPDAEVKSVGQENFDWVVETAANYAIEKALEHKENADNLTWGEYIKRSTSKTKLY